MNLPLDAYAQSSAAGVITAIAAVITAIGGAFLAFGVLLPILRQTKAVKGAVTSVEGQVKQVHTIVNQQRTDGLNFQRALIRALQDAGIEVPVDQSLPDEDLATPTPSAGP